MIYKTFEGRAEPRRSVGPTEGGTPGSIGPRDGHILGDRAKKPGCAEVGDYHICLTD